MKIESFSKYEITMEDINDFKNIAKDKVENAIIENEVHPIFEDLKLESFDTNSFIKLSYLAYGLLRNNDDAKIIEMSLKLIYWLIKKAENETLTNKDYRVEKELSNLYYMLGCVVYNGEINFIPWSNKSEIVGIKKDIKLSMNYLEKAFLLEPSYNLANLLGEHYFYSCENYYKAYSYLILNVDYLKETENYGQDAFMYTELGIFFDKENSSNKDIFAGEKAFICFERAYQLGKHLKLAKIEDFDCVFYNMAYAYIKGVGVKANTKKGISYLKQLEKKLTKLGKDICQIEDPDGIIKEYYCK